MEKSQYWSRDHSFRICCFQRSQ